jgi:hypothetical protein
MKKSEQLKIESQKEENDIKSFALGAKVIREERIEKFEETWLPKLKERYTVHYDANAHRYTFTTDHGVIDFYPKANKLLIRSISQWIKPGLTWIINKFLK